jgi:hypothetical protein
MAAPCPLEIPQSQRNQLINELGQSNGKVVIYFQEDKSQFATWKYPQINIKMKN